MKILLTAVNAKYIHSNLAVYSLSAYASKKFEERRKHGRMPHIEIAEYTINQPADKILADIYGRRPELLLFSCYIWNRKEIEQIAADMAKIRPELHIWLGGPEVSFDSLETLDTLTGIKGIIRGEGEEIFYRLAEAYEEIYDYKAAVRSSETGSIDSRLQHIEGITFRKGDGSIVMNKPCENLALSSVPFSCNGIDRFENRIVYYESSRGCPFGCSYCLSSIDKRLRFRDLELVKRELKYFLDMKVPQVKFIDRTFNCHHDRTKAIWTFIRDNDNGVTNFHFEIAGDLLDDEELQLIGTMRPGQIQLEIGVQSTNERTLREIDRPMDFVHLSSVVKNIRQKDNVHLHLDLIAGLPFEDYSSFRNSFEDVFSLRPHQLQLGFLKVLKGSPMEKRGEGYGLRATEFPPYEVLETNWMTYGELIRLKGIEEMVEVYYNSGQFSGTIELMVKGFDTAFDFFEALAAWYKSREETMLKLSRNQRYEKLLDFGREMISDAYRRQQLLQTLIYDYYLRENVRSRPAFLGEDKVEKSFSKAFYSRESREHRYLAGGRYDTDDPRLLRNLTHLERFGNDYYLFDYSRRNPMDNNATVIKLETDRL